jgi:hypothetical protein
MFYSCVVSLKVSMYISGDQLRSGLQNGEFVPFFQPVVMPHYRASLPAT